MREVFKAKVKIEAIPTIISNFSDEKSYQIGDIISLNIGREDAEEFYVINDKETYVTALSKYPLYVGTYCISRGKWDCDMFYLDSLGEEKYKLQDKDDFCSQSAREKGKFVKNCSKNIIWDDGYNSWQSNSLEDEYGYSYIFNNSSKNSLARVVLNYQNILQSYFPNVKVRLINGEEVNAIINSNFYAENDNNDYYTGFSSGNDNILLAFNSSNHQLNTNYVGSNYGIDVRPVIEILKNDLR